MKSGDTTVASRKSLIRFIKRLYRFCFFFGTGWRPESWRQLLTLIKKRKLKWFGHVSRSSGLAKTILQGTVKEKRKRGRQKKRWEDNIKEWTEMDFASSTWAAENRSRWKGIVAKSSVVPRRLPRLWARIE